MKDYYDVYFFLTKMRKSINLEIFRLALDNTLRRREAFEYFYDYNQILDFIAKDERITNYWNTYKKKNKYAENINFNEIIKILKNFLNNIN